MGLHTSQNIWDYIFELSTLRFYVSHDAPWFIAALIPLYLFSPLFYRLINSFSCKAIVGLIMIFYAMLLVPSSTCSVKLNDLIANMQFVSVRATCFILGMGLGQQIKEGKQMSVKWLVCSALIGIVVIAVTHHLVYGFFFFTLPLLSVFSMLLKHLGKGLKLCLDFMGRISLESYLLNCTLPRIIIIMFSALCITTWHNFIPYIVACLLGGLIGYAFSIVANRILDNIVF